jgi:hypothetical protein
MVIKMYEKIEEKINNLFIGKTKRRVKNIVKMLNQFQINNSFIDIEGEIRNAIIRYCVKEYSTLPKEFLKKVIKNKYFCGITIENKIIYLTFIVPYF